MSGRYQRCLVYSLYWIYACLGLLEYSFDWEQKYFTTLSRARCIFRFVQFVFTWLFLFVYIFVTPGAINSFSLMFMCIFICYPSTAFYRQSTNPQRTVAHMNRLFKCIRRTQRLTKAQICLPRTVYFLTLARYACLLELVVLCVMGMSFYFFLLTAFVFLLSYANMHFHTQRVCIQLFCINAQLRQLNDHFQEFSSRTFMHRLFQPSVRETASIYRTASKLLREFGEEHNVFLFVLLLESPIVLLYGQPFFTGINILTFFDVLFALYTYREIRGELLRSQSLAADVEVKHNPQLMCHVNCILVAASVGELNVKVYFAGLQTALVCTMPCAMANLVVTLSYCV